MNSNWHSQIGGCFLNQFLQVEVYHVDAVWTQVDRLFGTTPSEEIRCERKPTIRALSDSGLHRSGLRPTWKVT